MTLGRNQTRRSNLTLGWHFLSDAMAARSKPSRDCVEAETELAAPLAQQAADGKGRRDRDTTQHALQITRLYAT